MKKKLSLDWRVWIGLEELEAGTFSSRNKIFYVLCVVNILSISMQAAIRLERGSYGGEPITNNTNECCIRYSS
jgi:hypothetical protein